MLLAPAMGPDPAARALEALHEIERILSLAADPAEGSASALQVVRVRLDQLERPSPRAAEPPTSAGRAPGPGPGASAAALPDPLPVPSPDAGERALVVRALARAGHVQARAARLLGMTVRQLRYRIAKYQIQVERF